MAKTLSFSHERGVNREIPKRGTKNEQYVQQSKKEFL